MKINVMSVMVDDQAKALRFYTGVLGFVKKPGNARWDAGGRGTARTTSSLSAPFSR